MAGSATVAPLQPMPALSFPMEEMQTLGNIWLTPCLKAGPRTNAIIGTLTRLGGRALVDEPAHRAEAVIGLTDASGSSKHRRSRRHPPRSVPDLPPTGETAKDADDNARWENRRLEVLEAVTSFASKASAQQRVEFNRAKGRISGLESAAREEVRLEVYQLRAETYSAYYRLRLLVDPDFDRNLVDGAHGSDD